VDLKDGNVRISTGPTAIVNPVSDDEGEIVTVEVVLHAPKYTVDNIVTYGGAGIDVGLMQRAFAAKVEATYMDVAGNPYVVANSDQGKSFLDTKKGIGPWAGPPDWQHRSVAVHWNPSLNDFNNSNQGELTHELHLVDRPGFVFALKRNNNADSLKHAKFQVVFTTMVAIGYNDGTGLGTVEPEKSNFAKDAMLRWNIDFQGDFVGVNFTPTAGITPVTTPQGNQFKPVRIGSQETVKVDGDWTSDLTSTW
jgi:hypothetical protein